MKKVRGRLTLLKMILLQNVGKKFSGRTAVDNVSLEIGRGEIVGLLGPNGAGKTTTIRMIAGTLLPSSGQVFIDAEELSQHEEKKSLIGYLPENNPLYENLTVEEHLRFFFELKQMSLSRHSGRGPESDPGVAQDDRIKSVVKLLSLETVYYRPIGELSKGFKQRVGLSQTLLSDPAILLLDEPTEGLDPNQRREIQDLIKGLGKERTVVICSHVLSEVAKMCQRILIINQGRIVADDRVENLGQTFSERLVKLEEVFEQLTRDSE